MPAMRIGPGFLPHWLTPLSDSLQAKGLSELARKWVRRFAKSASLPAALFARRQNRPAFF